MEAHFAVGGGLQRGVGQRAHFHEPLVGEIRLEDRAAAVAVADGVGVRLRGVEEFLLAQFLQQRLAAFEAVHARVFAGVLVHRAVLVHDVDLREVVAQAHLEVGRVVRGRDLDRAGAEFRVHRVVGDDRDLALDDRQHQRSGR